MILMNNEEIFQLIEKDKIIINIWQPTETLIVLGRFCNEEQDLNPVVYKENLKIIRRNGGGGTVLLNDGVMIVEVGITKETLKKLEVKKYFEFFNLFIINSLKFFGIYANYDKEYYDITIKNKKLGGVSLAIRKDNILYGTSILLKKQTIIDIDKYLREPIKQPKYRMKRSHTEFLVSVEDFIEDNNILDNFVKIFKREFMKNSEVLINAVNKS